MHARPNGLMTVAAGRLYPVVIFVTARAVAAARQGDRRVMTVQAVECRMDIVRETQGTGACAVPDGEPQVGDNRFCVGKIPAMTSAARLCARRIMVAARAVTRGLNLDGSMRVTRAVAGHTRNALVTLVIERAPLGAGVQRDEPLRGNE